MCKVFDDYIPPSIYHEAYSRCGVTAGSVATAAVGLSRVLIVRNSKSSNYSQHGFICAPGCIAKFSHICRTEPAIKCTTVQTHEATIISCLRGPLLLVSHPLKG